EQRESYGTQVGDVMSKDIVTCQADDDYEEMLDAMKKRQIRRVPVVDAAKRLVGIIAQADVAREAPQPKEVAEVLERISQPDETGDGDVCAARYTKTSLLVAGGLGIGAGLIYLLNPRWARRAKETVASAAGNVRDTVARTAESVRESADSLRETV